MTNEETNPNKRTIPKLRFPKFCEEWRKYKLSDIAEIVGGGTPDTGKEEYWNGDIQWFTPTEIKTDYVSKSQRTISNLGLKESSAKLLPKGTILLTTRATIGDTAIALQECATNQGFQSLIVKDNNNIFVYNWLKTIKPELIKKANGSTFLEISKNEVENILIEIPSYAEQTKIANFLNLIDQLCQYQMKIIQKMESLSLSFMRKIFSQQIRFKDKNGENFPDWEIKKLGDIFYSEKGKGISKNMVIENGKYECVLYGELYTRYKEVIAEIVSKTDEYNGLKSQIGDLLLPSSTTTTGIDLANVTAINKENVLLGGDITVLRTKEKINNIFYAYYLSNHKKEEIASYAQGSTIVHLYYSHIKEMCIDIPSLEEQTKIANFLTSLDAKIETEKQLLEQYKQQKAYLLQNLFI